MRVFLVLILCLPELIMAKCYTDGNLKYKNHTKDLFLIYNEKEKIISIDEVAGKAAAKLQEISCTKIPEKDLKCLIETKSDICVFNKSDRKMVGKLLFRVVNYSNENTLTIQKDSEVEVIKESRFLASYFEKECSN